MISLIDFLVELLNRLKSSSSTFKLLQKKTVGLYKTFLDIQKTAPSAGKKNVCKISVDDYLVLLRIIL